ncbi:DoxX family protein [Tsuneonella sp. SYSU-LHT278]|uniref:DoxX family protein n=1 Tax=Tsuneonella sediminis TaxID=3416089 RepID=UPI003F79B62E
MGFAYAAAGILHLVSPGPFVQIVPGWVPFPEPVVVLTGIAELAGAAGLLQGRFPMIRRAAGVGLAIYALCVWPANFQHMALDMARADGGLGLGYHVPRLAIQPIIIWLALWTGEVTDWPLARHDP